MSFEAYQEKHIEAQVNAVFDDFTGMSIQERMGIVAFKLAPFIYEEKIAEQEKFNDWLERDKDVRQVPRKSRIPFGKMILDGFTGLGMGIVGGDYFATEPYKADVHETIPDELSEEPTHLEIVRKNLLNEKIIQSEIHGFTLKEIENVEKTARKLVPPTYL
jgi:hypothetical protein